jgi:TolA-binding protein
MALAVRTMTNTAARRFSPKAWVTVCLAALVAGAGPAGAQDSTKEPDAPTKKLMAAGGLLNKGLAKLAAEEYQAFLSENPNHPQAGVARYGLAVCHVRLSQFDEAIPLLEQILKDPALKQRDEAMALLGHCYLAKGQHDKALAAWEDLLKQFPQSPQAELAALNRAQTLYAAARYDQAADACKAFLDKYPNSTRKTAARYSLALAQFATGKHAEAAAVLEEVLKTPNSLLAFDSLLLLGQCREGQAKFADAAKQYEAALHIAPPARREECLYSLGVALYKAGDFSAADKQLAEVLAGPADGKYVKPARLELGLAQVAAGKLPEARKTLAAIARDDPPRAGLARYWLAQCDMADKKFEPALAALAALNELAAAKDKPEDLESILYDRAICEMSLEKDDPAEGHFAEFAKQFPQSKRLTDATYRQAFCLYRLKRYDQSLPLCRQAAAATGDSAAPAAAAAAELAAENLFQLAKYDEAEKAFQALATAASQEDRKVRLTLRLAQCAHVRGDYPQTIRLAEPLAGRPDALNDAGLRQAVFLLGDAQFQSAKYDQAARTLEKYLPKAGADKSEVRYKIGLAQLRSGNAEQGEKALNSLIARDEQSPWGQRARYELAQLAYRQKQPAKAADLLAKLPADKMPDDLAAPALYLQAWLDFDQARYAEAAERFGKLAEKFPRHALAEEAAYQQAVSLAEGGKGEPALAALRAYLQAHADGKHAADARRYVGRCLAKLGRHAEAVKEFAAVAADKKAVTAELLYEWAWSQRQAQDDGAAATYERLVTEFPQSPLAAAGRGEWAEALYAKQKYAEAAKLLEQLVADRSAKGKTLAAARYRLGCCYDKQDMPEKAAAALAAVAEQHADSELAAPAMYQAGLAYAKAGKPDQAAKLLANFAERYPKHEQAGPAMLKLGEMLGQQHENEESAAVYESFLRKFPQDKLTYAANFGIGQSLEARRKYDDARKAYEKVTAVHSGITAARAQYQIGLCYAAEGRHEKAAAELLKVEIIYASPEWCAKALLEAGKEFEAIKQVDQAKQQYNACAAKYKGSPAAEQAAKRLKEME